MRSPALPDIVIPSPPSSTSTSRDATSLKSWRWEWSRSMLGGSPALTRHWESRNDEHTCCYVIRAITSANSSANRPDSVREGCVATRHGPSHAPGTDSGWATNAKAIPRTIEFCWRGYWSGPRCSAYGGASYPPNNAGDWYGIWNMGHADVDLGSAFGRKLCGQYAGSCLPHGMFIHFGCPCLRYSPEVLRSAPFRARCRRQGGSSCYGLSAGRRIRQCFIE